MAIVARLSFVGGYYGYWRYPLRRLIRQVTPRNVAQSFCRAGLDTFGISIAKETLGGLVRI